ncbi:MAG TPA: hypothetical protein VFG86_05025 [Chloroflexota bacterium]|jgi:hypothetical protein|nr:hypothetical protein [Chloroflexota bacterium]
MLDPTMLQQLNELHRADIRRECEAEQLASLATQTRASQPASKSVQWPRLPWPLVFGLRRRHVAL